ncbi:hypothetical protein LCGC14_2609030, partial [marine sediment metagenome]
GNTGGSHLGKVSGTLDPWSMKIDLLIHDRIGHWTLFALLDASSSTERDWRLLGQITAAVIEATGYPQEAPRVEPLIPIAEVHPLTPLVWVWHSDGSAIDSVVADSLKGGMRIAGRRLKP